MGQAVLEKRGARWVESAYAAHRAELFRAARRSLGDDGLAEEAVQETFVRAWRAADRFDSSVASLRSWLFAILRNLVIDLARARAVRPALASARDGDSGDAIERALRTWQVEEALRRLREEHRHALVEVHCRTRPYAEVAAELGVPEGTVKSRVYYGLRAMRVALADIDGP